MIFFNSSSRFAMEVPRKRIRPINESAAAKVESNINAPALGKWENAIEIYNLHSMSTSDLTYYFQQLNICFTLKLTAVRSKPLKHFETAVSTVEKLKLLRESHAKYLLQQYRYIYVLTEEGDAKGWSLAGMMFHTILLETRLITAFEFMCRYVAIKHDCDSNAIPQSLYGVKIRKNVIKKIPAPKLFCSPCGLGERLPIEERYLSNEINFDPSKDDGCIDNLLVILPNTKLSRMSMLQLYSCWTHLVDQSYYMPMSYDESIGRYINSLIVCTAEVALESWDENDGFIDMGYDYKSNSNHLGVDKDDSQKDVRIGGDGHLLKEEKKTKDKKITAKNRFFVEICSMYVFILTPKILYETSIKPHLNSYSTLMTRCGLSITKMCNESGSDDPLEYKTLFKDFKRGIKKWLLTEMEKLENEDFRKRVADRMRADAVPSCARELYMFNNTFTAPRDVSAFEEAWYPRNGMTHVMKMWYKYSLNEFLSDAFPPSVRVLSVLFVFDLQITIQDREFKWLSKCYANRETTQTELDGMICDKKHPYIIQINDTTLVKLDDQFYKCHSIYDAVAAWLVNATYENGYSLFIKGEIIQVNWLQNILRDCASFIENELFKKNFSRDIHPMIQQGIEQYHEEGSEEVDYVFQK